MRYVCLTLAVVSLVLSVGCAASWPFNKGHVTGMVPKSYSGTMKIADDTGEEFLGDTAIVVKIVNIYPMASLSKYGKVADVFDETLAGLVSNKIASYARENGKQITPIPAGQLKQICEQNGFSFPVDLYSPKKRAELHEAFGRQNIAIDNILEVTVSVSPAGQNDKGEDEVSVSMAMKLLDAEHFSVLGSSCYVIPAPHPSSSFREKFWNGVKELAYLLRILRRPYQPEAVPQDAVPQRGYAYR